VVSNELSLILLLGVLGCDEPAAVHNVQVKATDPIQAQDFALNAVGGLIKNGMADSASLEQEINKPGDDNPYTRVDIDDDGKRDIILIDEVVPHEKFEFIAHPGNGVPDESIAVATFTTGDDGAVQYRANYTSYVNGYDNPDYRYYDTFTRDMLWIAWLTTPSRPLYLGVPTRYSFYRAVPRQQFIIRQTMVFHTTNIRVTPPAPRSMTFHSSSFSSRVTPPHTFSSTSRNASPVSHPASAYRSTPSVSRPTVTRSYSAPSRRR